MIERRAQLFDVKDQTAIITGAAQGVGGRCADVTAGYPMG